MQPAAAVPEPTLAEKIVTDRGIVVRCENDMVTVRGLPDRQIPTHIYNTSTETDALTSVIRQEGNIFPNKLAKPPSFAMSSSRAWVNDLFDAKLALRGGFCKICWPELPSKDELRSGMTREHGSLSYHYHGCVTSPQGSTSSTVNNVEKARCQLLPGGVPSKVSPAKPSLKPDL